MHPLSLVQDSATPCYHKLVASPLVVGKLFRCGCAVCACNAVWRIPQIDNDPVIHTLPRLIGGLLAFSAGPGFAYHYICLGNGWADQAKG